MLSGQVAGDVIETTDGRRIEGSARFADGAVYITSEQGPARLRIEQIAALRREMSEDVSVSDAVATGVVPADGLMVEYFSDTELTDFRSIGLIIPQADRGFSWGRHAPDSYTDPQFVVRLTGWITVPQTATYRFSQRWFNRAEIMGKSLDSPEMSKEGLHLEAGERLPVLLVKHRLEANQVTATLHWSVDGREAELIPPEAFSPPDDFADRLLEFHRSQLRQDPGGLKAEYFLDRDMKQRKLTILEPTISRSWSRATQLHPDFTEGFTARWTGQLKAPRTAVAKFRVSPRVRLWINNQEVVDGWPDGEQQEKEREGEYALEEGKRYDIRIEFYAPRGAGDQVRVHWNQEGGSKSISSRWLYPPADVPRARIVLPLDQAPIDTANGAALMLAALPGKGNIRKAEILDERGGVLGESTQPPFHVTIRPEQAGMMPVRARVTDSAGQVVISDTVTLSIVRAVSSDLPAAWSIGRIGGARAPKVTIEADRMTFEGHRGHFGEKVQYPLVSQLLGRDQQFVVRLVELQSESPDVAAMAGITLRRGMQPGDAHLTLVAIPREGWYIAHAERASQSSFITRPLPPPPVWLRIVRTGSQASADYSVDGQEWTRAGTMEIGNDEYLLAGVTALAMNQPVSVTAIFDQMAVRTGSSPYLATRPGLQLTSGSIIYGRVTADGSTFTVRPVEGRLQTFPRDQVARILYGPVMNRAFADLPRGWRGAVVRGDHLEGELTEITGEGVTVRSILFGIQKLTLRDDLNAAVINDVKPPAHVAVIHHQGGRALAQTLRLEKDRLIVTDPALGEMSFLIDDIAALERP